MRSANQLPNSSLVQFTPRRPWASYCHLSFSTWLGTLYGIRAPRSIESSSRLSRRKWWSLRTCRSHCRLSGKRVRTAYVSLPVACSRPSVYTVAWREAAKARNSIVYAASAWISSPCSIWIPFWSVVFNIDGSCGNRRPHFWTEVLSNITRVLAVREWSSYVSGIHLREKLQCLGDPVWCGYRLVYLPPWYILKPCLS